MAPRCVICARALRLDGPPVVDAVYVCARDRCRAAALRLAEGPGVEARVLGDARTMVLAA